jgi:hypothetical protein
LFETNLSRIKKKSVVALLSGNEMNSRLYRILIIILPVLLSAHLLMLGCAAFQEYLGPSVSERTQAYTTPLFPASRQTPGKAVATSDCNLEFRSFKSARWSDWQDASGGFGYSPQSTTEQIEQALCEEFRWEVLHNLYAAGGKQQFDHIIQGSTYSKALYFIVRLERLSEQTASDSIQLRLNYRFTPPPDQAYTFQRSFLEFPAFDLP